MSLWNWIRQEIAHIQSKMYTKEQEGKLKQWKGEYWNTGTLDKGTQDEKFREIVILIQ